MMAVVVVVITTSACQLSLFAFHVTLSAQGGSIADEDTATRTLVERVVARGRVYVMRPFTHARIDLHFTTFVRVYSL
jgi:hypothetical protein